MPNRALRAPPAFAASLILIYPPKLFLRPELGLSCILLSYIASTELRCTLLSYGYTTQASWELEKNSHEGCPLLLMALWTFFETQPRAHGSSLKLPRHLLHVLMTAPWEFLNTLPSLMGALKKIRNAAFN
jgi:hypothetical protein